eukprot:3961752-Amphidinium_carterae.1
MHQQFQTELVAIKVGDMAGLLCCKWWYGYEISTVVSGRTFGAVISKTTTLFVKKVKPLHIRKWLGNEMPVTKGPLSIDGSRNF